MSPVRVACVRYLNTAPLIEGLEKLAGAELLLTVPSRIADLVRERRADVGLVSTIDAGGLALLPVGMIGCDGPTLTVRLFSSVPLKQITTIHADSDSHTSVVLARILLHHLHGIRPAVVTFDARERVPLDTPATADLDASWPKTVLLIGDKVVTDAPPADRYPHQLDLGEAWHELTGLPFVYAMWMCRADEADSGRTRAAAALLDRQRRRNAARLDWLIARRAPEHRWPVDLARTYLRDRLRFVVGPREREAVERFLAEAAALNLIEAPAVRWADTEPATAR